MLDIHMQRRIGSLIYHLSRSSKVSWHSMRQELQKTLPAHRAPLVLLLAAFVEPIGLFLHWTR